MARITASPEELAEAGERPGWRDTLKRIGRVAVATTIGGILEAYKDDPRMLALTPILTGIGKKLRDRFPKLRSWFPF